MSIVEIREGIELHSELPGCLPVQRNVANLLIFTMVSLVEC